MLGEYYLVLTEFDGEKEHLNKVLCGPMSEEVANKAAGRFRTAYEKWYDESKSVEILTEEEMQEIL